jgi:phosphoglycolate phosphatase
VSVIAWPGRRHARAVVFDLDGTLADSAPDIATALNTALAASSLTAFALEDVKRMVGGGARRLVERALSTTMAEPAPALVETVLAAFGTAYGAAPCRETVLFPGAREALVELAAQGFRLGVCTNKPERVTDAVLEGLGVQDMFGKVVGGSSRLALKPAPDMLREVMSGLGVAAEEAVMVGDSSADVGAARAAGLRCILMGHGYSTTPVGELGADVVVEGFHRLPSAVRAMTAV